MLKTRRGGGFPSALLKIPTATSCLLLLFIDFLMVALTSSHATWLSLVSFPSVPTRTSGLGDQISGILFTNVFPMCRTVPNTQQVLNKCAPNG